MPLVIILLLRLLFLYQEISDISYVHGSERLPGSLIHPVGKSLGEMAGEGLCGLV